MPHRRPSSPLDNEQAAVNLRRSSSDTSKPQRFLAKLKHANLASSSSNTPAPAPSLPLPTSTPGPASPSPATPTKATPATQNVRNLKVHYSRFTHPTEFVLFSSFLYLQPERSNASSRHTSSSNSDSK